MEYIYVGIIVNTHALKGEIRIISNFDKTNKVFIKDKNLYIGESKNKEKIETYRLHKNYHMVKFLKIDYINDVLKYKGKKVYVLREDLELKETEYLETDLIGLNAYYKNNLIGKITDIVTNNNYKLFEIKDKYIPYNNNFLETINIKENKIIFKNLEGII